MLSKNLEKLIAGADPQYKNIQAYALKQLRERAFFQALLNAIQEGVLVIDRKLKISFVNKAGKDMLGLPEDSAGHNISRFIRDIEWEKIFKLDVKDWHRVSRREIEISYPRFRRLLFYVIPHETDKGTVAIVLHDITEVSEKNSFKIESEKNHLVSLLAAGVAHELGNPLNSLGLNLQLLDRILKKKKTGKKFNEEAGELLEASLSEVKRLDIIIKEFLKAVRHVPIKASQINLQEITGEVLYFMKQEFADRMIQLECIWPEAPVNIQGDEVQLKQAFYNILTNALQAMPQGGKLEISLKLDDDSPELVFKDSGVGIPTDSIASIFNPYYSTKNRGSGLGLMIVERILREHGAKLSVKSCANQGSEFIILFPARNRKRHLLPAAPDMKT